MQADSEETLTAWELYKKWEPLYKAQTKEEKAVAWQKLYNGLLTKEDLELLLDESEYK